MSTGTLIGLMVLGLLAGLVSSMVGIGGGLIVVPGLVFLFAMNQKMAQGTSLAMLLPPIGFLAVMQYHKENFVDWQKAAIICATFIIGSYFGAKLALSLPVVALKKVFAVFLLLVAAKYLFLDK